MALTDTGTTLSLLTMGIPFYSAKRLHQRIFPAREIKDSSRNIVRASSGALLNLTPPQMLKYATEISAQDTAPPSLDGIWPGSLITVWSAAYLVYPVGGVAQRSAVGGTTFTSNGFVYYAPILQCMLLDFEEEFSEWEGTYSWKLTLEEAN